ncbi:MAG: hypothetical protein ACI8YQ_004291 [Polaribacter sp.]|jgi:hypothetical protein
MKISINITDNQFSAATKEEMWNIYKKYYNYSKSSFMERVANNNHFSLYTNQGKIVGFTGLRINKVQSDKKSKLLIYFGQTVIDKQFRGKALLPITGAKLCMKYFWDLLRSDVYFWCDALNYKPYLVFAKTLADFYPTRKRNMPKAIKNLIDFIGNQHYKESYCPETGTVLKPVNLVSDLSVRVYENDRKDVDIQFYMKGNPGYIDGHGLITLAPVNFSNFNLLLKRFINK